jgi:hypothetical protein
MTKVICDEAMRAMLDHGDEHLELCDESGRTLGYFVPTPVNEPALYEGVESPISAEELERRRHETGGQTLAEIWARLGRS